jgi:group I intron endonuclease
MGIIYKATCKINDKCYIGKSGSLTVQDRKKCHEYNALKRNWKGKFYNAIRKYGTENFIWEKLFEVNNTDLAEMETETIKAFDSYENGYNLKLESLYQMNIRKS